MRWRLLALGLCAYAVALVVTAPAALLDAGLGRASNGRVRLADASGSLWSGVGELEFLDAGGSAGIARSLVWRVRPASLLRGRLVCEVGLGDTARRFPVTLSLEGFAVENADVSLPTAVLGLAVPKLAPLELTGHVRILLRDLSVKRQSLRGHGTLEWRDAGSALSPVAPIGSYELRFNADGVRVTVALRTLQGPIRIDGRGSWSTRARPAFRGTARVPPQYRQQLSPLLRLISVERSPGTFDLSLQ